MTTPLVRHGADATLPIDRESGESGHVRAPVYREMVLQICRTYSGLPDVRTLTDSQIRFFYNGIRGELHETTKAPKR